MNTKTISIYTIAGALLVVILVRLIARGTLMKQAAPELAPSPVPDSVGSTSQSLATDAPVNWKTWRSEQFGVEFKYPAEWPVENASSSDYVGYGLFIVANHDYANPPLLSLNLGKSMSVYVSRRECSKGGFDPVKAGTILAGEKIEETRVNGFTLAAFRMGCYEPEGLGQCSTDGVFAAACNSKASGCLVIQMRSSAGTFDTVKNFFLNEVFPTIQIDRNFNDIQCIESPLKG
jgi:hypothetical protein